MNIIKWLQGRTPEKNREESEWLFEEGKEFYRQINEDFERSNKNLEAHEQARDQSIIDQIELDVFGTTKTDGFSRYIHNPERRKDWLRITGDEPPLKPHFIYNWRRDIFIEHIAPNKKKDQQQAFESNEINIQQGLVQVTCACCSSKNWYHSAQNACTYSPIPNYGCKKCQGIPSKKGR